KASRHGFKLETVEPRLLLSADISYSALAGTDLHLQAKDATHVALYDGGTELGNADTSGGAITIERAVGAGTAFADTIHFDLNTFSTLSAPAGGALSITFDGGDQRLQHDKISLDGNTGPTPLAFGLSVISNSEIHAGGTVNVTGDLT